PCLVAKALRPTRGACRGWWEKPPPHSGSARQSWATPSLTSSFPLTIVRPVQNRGLSFAMPSLEAFPVVRMRDPRGKANPRYRAAAREPSEGMQFRHESRLTSPVPWPARKKCPVDLVLLVRPSSSTELPFVRLRSCNSLDSEEEVCASQCRLECDC